jgi:hypothetical protein
MFEFHFLSLNNRFIFSMMSFRRKDSIPSAGRTSLGQTSLHLKMVSHPQTPASVFIFDQLEKALRSRGSLTRR